MNRLNLKKRLHTEWNKFLNRRKAPRFDASVIPFLKKVQQIDGPEVKLINISRGGALIETYERMLPGSRVTLRLDTEEAVYRLDGQVLRCYVYEINQVVTYQYAVAFDKDFRLLPKGKEIS